MASRVMAKRKSQALETATTGGGMTLGSKTGLGFPATGTNDGRFDLLGIVVAVFVVVIAWARSPWFSAVR